ncbi:hypothetical protein [Streptomyces sp. NBC_00568]|uniref:hypothetical protein n=1 Tax=Streptomyces sp. NBC_00568 TaxID=2975779 RepID=UPI0022582AB3|nr:hypothetical protein [Streptomyces sp. NBC_00568]MCX4993579.1 hypothetical protein [Streptomyces sp. NBC_00568]
MSALSDAAGRQACVDAWAEVIFAHPQDWSPGEAETPEECPSKIGSTWADLYMLGRDKAEEKRLLLPPIDDGASLAAEESPSETDQP